MPLAARPRVTEAQVQGAEAQHAAEFGAMPDMAADAVRPPQQGLGARHVAAGQRRPHGRARHAQAMHLVAHHAGDVETGSRPGGVQHRVVAGAPGAETEIVADQHIACMQALLQHIGDEGLRRHRCEGVVETQHHRVVDAAALQLGQLVAQRRDARRRRLGLAGLACEVVARMRLEGQHAGRHAAVPRFADQQRQHRLVAAVHAVEIADRDGAAGQAAASTEAKAAMDLHRPDYPGGRPSNRR